MRYKLIVSYDGTNYAGWQVQKNGQAIQPIIQNALQTILRHPINLTGSGRTDAGVHARGQIAHFDTEVSFDPKKLLISLNALLPLDIRIFQIDPVPATFHARYSASSKIYHYHLHLDPVADPFTQLYRHQIFGSFDLKKLKEGACQFIGTHDFTSFVNASEEKDRVRTLFRLDIVEQKGGIRLEFEGDGFLYKMVRNMVGTLIDVGVGKTQPEEIPLILSAKDRRKSGPAAPAKGLFLMQVCYRALGH